MSRLLASGADVRAKWKGGDLSEEEMLAEVLAIDFTNVTQLRWPMIVINGRHDPNVSASLAAEWIARLRAPQKTLVWFENSTHLIPSEEPGKMLVELVEKVRPLAVRAGGWRDHT